MIRINEIAAEYHKHLADHAAHGYTQGSGRNGSGGTERVNILGVPFDVILGDRDCSSSGSEAWQKSLALTKYKGILNGMTYTGNALLTAKKSDLFDIWDFNSRNLKKARRGDILLVHDSKHGHMGIYQGNGKSTEFLGNEKGTILGGKVGDQTGHESVCRSATAYPYWRYILHYNGKADLESLNFEVKKDTNVRTGRDTSKYRKVAKLHAGDVVAVDKIVKDAHGKVWAHVANTHYRWFVIHAPKQGTRAIAKLS